MQTGDEVIRQALSLEMGNAGTSQVPAVPRQGGSEFGCPALSGPRHDLVQ